MAVFKDAISIWQVIYGMLQAEQPRASNRARINDIFNGNPPYTEKEARDNRIFTNVNFLEGTRILHNARAMYENALLKPSNFFNIKLDTGPRSKRDEWSNIVTSNLNRFLKRSRKYNTGLKSSFAGVTLHGIGPCTWLRDRDWCPKFRGVEDFLVPSGTLTDMSNLEHYAVYTTFTAAELIRMSMGPDPAWNKPLIQQILEHLRQQIPQGTQPGRYTNYQYPEKIVEDFKENSGWWGADMIPVCRCYDFYFLDVDTDEQNPQWRRRIVLDQLSMENFAQKDQYLYDSGNRSYGTHISELMHVLFGNGAVVPPFRWHSVRSLGYLLYAVCHLNNRLRCKFTDAVFESMLWYFRNVADGDRERLQKIDLQHLGVVPEGVSWVLPNERHTINEQLLTGAFSMNRQLMAESSATYQQDPDTGTAKEQTATEVMAKVQSANALVGSMLTNAYADQTYQYREIARRFCTLNHPDCVEFRRQCMEEGVDKASLDATKWDISPEKAMGNGNKMLQIAQADKLMAVRPMLPPAGQTIVLHQYVEANSDDPHLADQIVPLEGSEVSSSVEKATFAWGTLVTGLPVALGSEVNLVEYINTLLKMLTSQVVKVEGQGNNPGMEKTQELGFVLRHIKQQVQIVAQDKTMAEQVREWMDVIGRIENELKGYAQRAVEQAAAEQDAKGQGGQADAAKAQATLQQAAVKSKVTEETAAQKAAHRDGQFQQDQARKTAETQANIQRQATQTSADIALSAAKTRAEIRNGAKMAEAQASGDGGE